MSKKQESKKVVLSAGGTGGHMFPAAALSDDLLSRGFEVVLVTDSRGKKYEGSFNDAKVHVIKSGTLGAGIFGKIKGVGALGIGLLQAKRMIDKIKPDVVVGFGGYPSVPSVYAAQKKHIPTIIHEQNAIVGKANAFLAPKADRIALSMASVDGLDSADAVRVIVTGNPVRAAVAELFTKPYPIAETDGDLKLFIMGGSLGAGIFSEVVPLALSKLDKPYRERLDVVQQCRIEDIDNVRDLYKKADIKARLETFFDDVPKLLADCHLVISRSGASTVAEVTAAGRPAIFVPYPHHADNQQKKNADAVAEMGGGWVLPQSAFTEDSLLERVETFLQSPELLFRAAEASRSCGKPDAARRLGNLVTALASGWDKDALKSFDLTQGLRG
jgi:UDP-N-acetylglucosamine--N-acetylmuramyl-(pentapeptide) pyrophosphoryl-undecaprenol N-acetylglucosamine transferase